MDLHAEIENILVGIPLNYYLFLKAGTENCKFAAGKIYVWKIIRNVLL
jgi:hypothetical protein